MLFLFWKTSLFLRWTTVLMGHSSKHAREFIIQNREVFRFLFPAVSNWKFLFGFCISFMRFLWIVWIKFVILLPFSVFVFFTKCYLSNALVNDMYQYHTNSIYNIIESIKRMGKWKTKNRDKNITIHWNKIKKTCSSTIQNCMCRPCKNVLYYLHIHFLYFVPKCHNVLCSGPSQFQFN